MDTSHIISFAGVIFLAGLTQSAVGLGYALIAVPVFVLLGMSLPAAIATMYVCSFVQSVSGVVNLRAHIPWKSSLTAAIVITAIAAASLSVLKKITFLDPRLVKMIVGFVLCLLSAIQLFFTSRPLKAENRFWEILAFSVSGALTGVCGMGGPPLALWAISRGWSVKKTRGFLFSVFTALIPVQVLLLIATFGHDILRVVLNALPLLPAALAGTLAGLFLGNRTPEKIFVRIVNLTLLLAGAGMILQNLA